MQRFSLGLEFVDGRNVAALGRGCQATNKNTRTRTAAPKTTSPKTKAKKSPPTLGLRWPVERTNSWMSNFGQLRRNTDRCPEQRLGQIALAITLILTVKLVTWAKRWND